MVTQRLGIILDTAAKGELNEEVRACRKVISWSVSMSASHLAKTRRAVRIERRAVCGAGGCAPATAVFLFQLSPAFKTHPDPRYLASGRTEYDRYIHTYTLALHSREWTCAHTATHSSTRRCLRSGVSQGAVTPLSHESRDGRTRAGRIQFSS